ncbi:alpha/beta fold hydrolase [Haloarchaeobius sp. HME9146]|uniref:alpha/beta fold hydrolase n=1 Tax=Haloarchaeobius sp. HME9146 TaxID=2978732 RepID=UPI0021BEA52E|nr:alpha/beta hydrolase [Haloarchaeobius sp. HME9146]MCT9097798.1 alpha/beta hydrolase [Haloarchaeobius sp. HME9146]
MSGLEAVSRRLLGKQRAELPYLGDGATGMRAVARRLVENPSVLTLSDGRTLGYAETGDPAGRPVLTFHGIPNGRLGAAVFDQVGRDLGVRVIAPERPGVGVSDPDPSRELTGWPADVVELLDALDIDAAPVLGISGGGPYALACGAVAPERFPRVAVCCSSGPLESVPRLLRLMIRAAIHVPWVIRAFLGFEVRSARYAPGWTIERRVRGAAPRDESVWRGDVGKLLVASIPAACQHHGTAAFVRDLQLFGQDWPFSLAAIDVPVGIWHGRGDRINPVEMGTHLLDAIPTAEGHFYPELGHLSIFVEHDAEMFEWLVR